MNCKDCKEIFDLINLYIDNEITSDEKNILFDHMESCENCRNDFENLKDFVLNIQDIDLEELPNNYHNEIMKKIKNNSFDNMIEFNSINKKKNIWYKYGTLVAVFALFIFIGNKNNIFKNNHINSDVNEIKTIENSYDNTLQKNDNSDIISKKSRNIEPDMKQFTQNYDFEYLLDDFSKSIEKDNEFLINIQTNIKCENLDYYNSIIDIAKSYSDNFNINENHFTVLISSDKYDDFINNINSNNYYQIEEIKNDFTEEYNNLINELNILDENKNIKDFDLQYSNLIQRLEEIKSRITNYSVNIYY